MTKGCQLGGLLVAKNIGQPYVFEYREMRSTRDLFTTRLSITDTNENNNSTTRCE